MTRLLRRLAWPALAALGALGAPASAEALVLTPVGTFAAPTYAAAPPGDGRRLMVVERGGTVRVVRDGVTLSVPFLDVTPSVDASGEGGLLSIAFPPDYVQSGLFYVFLTTKDANPGAAPFAPIEVREYRRDTADPDRALPGSARTVLQIPHPDFANHYGGGLQFGPDGLLYVSTGDGGAGGDPDENGQDISSRLGKLLRVDPRASGPAAFSVPPTNPYVGVTGDDLVWSYGLRNPFRFSFDRATGDLTIGDVGQNAVEEVDFVRAADGGGRGVNFGWNACEGPLAFPITPAKDPCTLPGATGPVLSYEAMPPCNSVTGGVVVRDPGLEELAGRYIYGDFCHGFIRHAQLATPAATDDDDSGLAVSGAELVAFGEDACGRVHVVQLSSGAVSRLEDDTPTGCDATVVYPAATSPYPPPRGATPGGRPGTVAAVTGLRAVLGGPRRQRAARRRAVLVRLRCSARCRARARGRLSLRGADGRRLRLRGAARVLAAGARVTLRLRLSRGVRDALVRRLRGGRWIRAGVTVRVADLTGRVIELTRTVRIVG